MSIWFLSLCSPPSPLQRLPLQRQSPTPLQFLRAILHALALIHIPRHWIGARELVTRPDQQRLRKAQLDSIYCEVRFRLLVHTWSAQRRLCCDASVPSQSLLNVFDWICTDARFVLFVSLSHHHNDLARTSPAPNRTSTSAISLTPTSSFPLASKPTFIPVQSWLANAIPALRNRPPGKQIHFLRRKQCLPSIHDAPSDPSTMQVSPGTSVLHAGTP